MHVDPETKWYNLEDPDKGIGLHRVDPQLQFTIPICALAPTVPRRIVPNVGYNKTSARVSDADRVSHLLNDLQL